MTDFSKKNTTQKFFQEGPKNISQEKKTNQGQSLQNPTSSDTRQASPWAPGNDVWFSFQVPGTPQNPYWEKETNRPTPCVL